MRLSYFKRKSSRNFTRLLGSEMSPDNYGFKMWLGLFKDNQGNWRWFDSGKNVSDTIRSRIFADDSYTAEGDCIYLCNQLKASVRIVCIFYFC